MRSRSTRASSLAQDPTTSIEAGQAIYDLAHQIGWTGPFRRRFTSRRPTNPYGGEKLGRCTICGDTYLGYLLERLSCGHRHCRPCLTQNFQYVLSNPSSYPAKCCKGLPLSETSFVLSDAEIKGMLELQATHEASKVIPCFECQGEIQLSDIGRDAAYCIDCHKLTCTLCRKEMHDDLCPEDPETEKLRELAKEQGWSQCPKCNRVIHRVAGCNSMTCLCKTNFCFRCGCMFANCICKAVPFTLTAQTSKLSNANIAFGKAFTTAHSGGRASFKERINYRILRDAKINATKNRENKTFKLKDLQMRRKEKEKDDGIAREIIRLRAKMKELAAIEKVKNREARLRAKLEGTEVVSEGKRVIVTRRKIYGWNGNVGKVEVNDSRPVAKRTRSQTVV